MNSQLKKANMDSHLEQVFPVYRWNGLTWVDWYVVFVLLARPLKPLIIDFSLLQLVALVAM